MVDAGRNALFSQVCYIIYTTIQKCVVSMIKKKCIISYSKDI